MEAVAVARRVLEPLLGRGLAHLPLELGADRPVVPGEELDHAVDHLAVVLLRDVPDARREAALDVVVEARDAAAAAGLRALAGPVAEDAVEDVERLAHLLRVGVRAEVDDAAPVPLAREHHARVLVLEGDRDVRERLVVAQPHVERRPVALDEVLLEMERLDLAAGDDRLDLGDALGERVDPGAGVAAPGLEVLAHARAQRLRLADVENLAAARRGTGRRRARPEGASAAADLSDGTGPGYRRSTRHRSVWPSSAPCGEARTRAHRPGRLRSTGRRPAAGKIPPSEHGTMGSCRRSGSTSRTRTIASVPNGDDSRRGPCGREGRVRGDDRRVRAAVRLSQRVLDDRCATRQRLLPLEDHAAIRRSRRPRRSAQCDAARRLARRHVLVPGDLEGLPVHERTPGTQDHPPRPALPRRLPLREGSPVVRAARARPPACDGRAHSDRERARDRSTTTRRTRSGSTTRSS